MTALENTTSKKILLPGKSRLPTQNESTTAVSSRRLIFINSDT